MPPTDRSRLRHGLFGIYVAVCVTMICWPGYAWLGNSIEPYVLGLPFSLAWVVGWVLLTFLVLVVYHLSAQRSGDGRPDGGEE
jgi:hypothetical protein